MELLNEHPKGEPLPSHHPDDTERLLWVLGELSAADQARVEVHVETCARCAADVAGLRRSISNLETHGHTADPVQTGCLDEAQIAALVDGLLEPDDKTGVLSHLAVCHRCCQATASLVRALQSEPIAAALSEHVAHRRAINRRLRIGAASALAAAAGLVGLLMVWPSEPAVTPAPVQREPSVGVAAAAVLQEPIGESAAPEEFRWSPVSGADRYRVTVFDDQANVVWETETQETRAAPPATVGLRPGVQYLWKVAARVAWDRWVDSELVRFSIAEP